MNLVVTVTALLCRPHLPAVGRPRPLSRHSRPSLSDPSGHHPIAYPIAPRSPAGPLLLRACFTTRFPMKSILKTLRLTLTSTFLAVAGPANAAVVVWTGGGPAASWSNATNWGTGPLPDDVARFTDTGVTTGLQIDLDVTPTLNQLHFSGTTLPFTVAGGNVSLNGSGTGKVGLLRNGSATDVQNARERRHPE